MELKYLDYYFSFLVAACFNRTFMELKYIENSPDVNLEECFNRTFMELKLEGTELLSKRNLHVLIVPLWN